jgi:ATP-dependent DNA helicase RecG
MAECSEPTFSGTCSANNITSNLRVKIEDLVNWQSVEGQILEFKAAWNTGPTKIQIVKTVSAFANDFYNDNGGYVVIGVAEVDSTNSEDSQQIELPPKGINPKDSERIQKQIMVACKTLISPPYYPIISSEKLQDKLVLVIWAQASDNRPHKAKVSIKEEGHYFIRKGPETTKASVEEIKSLQQNANKIPFDDRMARLGMFSHLSLVSIWSLVVAGTTSGSCEIV